MDTHRNDLPKEGEIFDRFSGTYMKPGDMPLWKLIVNRFRLSMFMLALAVVVGGLALKEITAS